MTELEKYIKSKEPKVDSLTVRIKMEAKAQEMADKFVPDDPDKNKLGANFYLLAMYDMVELIYN